MVQLCSFEQPSLPLRILAGVPLTMWTKRMSSGTGTFRLTGQPRSCSLTKLLPQPDWEFSSQPYSSPTLLHDPLLDASTCIFDGGGRACTLKVVTAGSFISASLLRGCCSFLDPPLRGCQSWAFFLWTRNRIPTSYAFQYYFKMRCCKRMEFRGLGRDIV